MLPARKVQEIPGAPPPHLKKKTMIKDRVGAGVVIREECGFGVGVGFGLAEGRHAVLGVLGRGWLVSMEGSVVVLLVQCLWVCGSVSEGAVGFK